MLARGLEAIGVDPYTRAGGGGIPGGLLDLEGVWRGCKTPEDSLQ